MDGRDLVDLGKILLVTAVWAAIVGGVLWTLLKAWGR